MTGLFALLCLIFATRFAFPSRFAPIVDRLPSSGFPTIAGATIGLSSGLAGVGGGILTNIVMTLAGMPMHKSIGRAAAAGVVVSLPATFVAAFAPGASEPMRLGSIDLAVWASIAPAQALAVWYGARLAQRVAADNLSRIMAIALLATGIVMLHSSVTAR
ncbi:MAG: sulfite exporter TauE/SafE family protein [Stellaceae bacterium]